MHPSSPAKKPNTARRSLAHIGGAVRLAGDPELALALEHALDVLPATSKEAEAESRPHVHGFHPYPARLHPKTSGAFIDGLLPERGTVLDPFCGSGTVLVEARLRGHRAIGFDLNPIAILLSTLKTHSFDARTRDEIVALATTVSEEADARRKAKRGASRRYPAEDVEAFDPHVLLELDGLRVGIETYRDHPLIDVLALLLSSILAKLSRRDGDTSAGTRAMRIAAGYPARLYKSKAKELATFLETTEALYAGAPEASLHLSDARDLRGVKPGSVDLVVTSPPYPGVYDYVEHHRTRMRWLELDPRGLDRGEIGARRRLRTLESRDAIQSFEDDMARLFESCARVLTPRGRAVFVIADGALRHVPLRADEIMTRAARRASFVRVASASQERPHFHGGSQSAFKSHPRCEHALLFGRG